MGRAIFIIEIGSSANLLVVMRLFIVHADVPVKELAVEIFAQKGVRVRLTRLLVLRQMLCSALGWYNWRFSFLLDHSLPVDISKEGVFLDLARSTLLLQPKALVGQLVSQALEQILKLLAEIVLRGQVSKANIIGHSIKICVLEGWTACCQLVHDDTERPPV